MNEQITEPESEWPYIVLFYPVLRELEATMRTTFLSLTKLDYPPDRYRVVAIPTPTTPKRSRAFAASRRSFRSWRSWRCRRRAIPRGRSFGMPGTRIPKPTGGIEGRRAGRHEICRPKKTRQLIYALYHIAEEFKHEKNLVINYIDADSCPPTDHFKGAVIGLKHYDVLQAQNVAGNLNDDDAASWHAFDHMAWDGYEYPHLLGARAPAILGARQRALLPRLGSDRTRAVFIHGLRSKIPRSGCGTGQNGKRLGITRRVRSSKKFPKPGCRASRSASAGSAVFSKPLGQAAALSRDDLWQRFKCLADLLPVPVALHQLYRSARRASGRSTMTSRTPTFCRVGDLARRRQHHAVAAPFAGVALHQHVEAHRAGSARAGRIASGT